MTSKDHKNGTSRCNEVLELLHVPGKEKFDVVVNIQGDEPFINPQQIEAVVDLFKNPDVEIGTLAKKIQKSNELSNQNVVKVVLGDKGFALYFSRFAIPYLRDIFLRNMITCTLRLCTPDCSPSVVEYLNKSTRG